MSRRQSLSEILNGLADNPEDDFALAEIQEAYEVAGVAETFRYHAPTTEARRDLHLSEVLNFFRTCKRIPPETPMEQVQQQLFGSTHDQVLRTLKGYFAIAMKFCKPRATADTRPRYQTLLARRFSMVFWVNRLMPAPLSRATIINSTNRILQFAGRKYGVNKSISDAKLYMGRHELAQLIEADMMRTPYMPLAENHHLAWCLGLVCGVRPGTMAEANMREGQCLQWKDVTILRGVSPGEFSVKITFLHLKGNRDNLEKREFKKFVINSPTLSEFIPLSPAHRLLVMLLRRGYLRDHETSISLLEGRERQIRIKNKALEKPVLLAGGPKGVSVSQNAMSGRGLSRYMSEIAADEGYGRGATLYAWRRKAGTEVQRQMGTEAAQNFMSHEVGTDTFWKHYDQGHYDTPIFEIAMRQDTQAATMRMDEESTLVLTRFDTTRTKGIFLERVVRRLEVDSTELAAAVARGDPREVRNIKRRIQRTAKRTLYEQEQKLQQESQSIDEFEVRKQDLRKPGGLMKKIVLAARKSLQEGTSGTSTSMAPPPPPPGSRSVQLAIGSKDVALEYPDLRDEDDIDPDIDEAVMDVDEVEGEMTTDSHGNLADVEESTDEFLDAVVVFFECMSQDRFVPLESLDLHCQLCIDDPYMDSEAKNKVWPNSTKLRIHERSKIHCSKMKMLRKLNYICLTADGVVVWTCPYSSEDNPCNQGYAFSDRATLVRHIEHSTAASTSASHDEDKWGDGWYEPDFNFDPSSNAGRVAIGRKRMHLVYSDEMEAEPREIAPGIWEASGHTLSDVLPQYQSIVFTGENFDINAQSTSPIPILYQNIVFSGDDEAGRGRAWLSTRQENE